jgi:hypothetical protein
MGKGNLRLDPKKSDFSLSMVTDREISDSLSGSRHGSGNDTTDSPKGKGKSKYGNNKVERDGIIWDSEWEYQCWQMLTEMSRRGEIFDLRRQRIFPFVKRGIQLTRLKSDFTFDAIQKDLSHVPQLHCLWCGEKTCFLKLGAIIKCTTCGKQHLWEQRIPDVVADAKSRYVSEFAKFKIQEKMMLAFYQKEVLVLLKEDGPAGVENSVRKFVLQFQNR